MWVQKKIVLSPKPRGFHLITRELLAQLPEIKEFRIGLAQFFLCHTSASLTINENADPSVRADMEAHLSHFVPENAPYYEHTLEGPDDMPAHIKASLLGASVVIPIGGGRLLLGTWQGIYLGEHRNRGGARTVIATLFGE
ncbi:MAG: secondary thiamine-phosphate synthase enzyme YjbQ [Methylohalobius sp.]